MPVINPMIKFVTFEPIGTFPLGDKDLHFHEAPGGISFSVTHLNPVNSRRTQDGTLITQTLKYNKKVINLSFSFYDLELKTYFQTLYESGLRLTLSLWVENPTTFIEETEFTGIVQMLSLDEDVDQSANIRSFNMVLSEA